MFPFFRGNMYPWSDLHTLNLDWLVKIVEENDTITKELKDNLPSEVYDAVTKYFTEHEPINIENNSIDTTKLKHSKIPFYNVTDFGIMPDTGDVYRAIHAFMQNVVSLTGGIVYFPKGKYTTSFTIFIPENTTIIGDGFETEIYFNEEDIAFGVALCNAGSNVKICNMKVSHASTGIFHSGPQPGCIGLGDISIHQIEEPPYSHNFIRASYTCNLSAENILFSGNYPIQTEPLSGRVENVTYKNLVSNGTISVQSNNTAEINNVLIENCTGDLLRILVGNRTKNININNVIVNEVNIYNGNTIPVILKNIINTSEVANNDYDDSGTKNKITGNTVFTDCYFTEDSSTVFGISEASGIHYFERCIFNFPHSRVWTRLVALAENNNFAIINNSHLINNSEGSTSVICGYGCNNIYEGLITSWLFGDIYFKYVLGGSISATNQNSIYINGNRVHLHITSAFDSVNAIALPTKWNMPYDTSQPLNVTLFNGTSDAKKFTWAFIENNVIVLREPNIDISSYNRIIIDCDIPLTRALNPVEVYSLLG